MKFHSYLNPHKPFEKTVFIKKTEHLIQKIVHKENQIIFLIFSFIITIQLQAQKRDLNQNNIDSLLRMKENYLDRIQEIDNEIRFLRKGEIYDTIKYHEHSNKIIPTREDEYSDDLDKQNIQKLIKIGSPIYFISARVDFNSIGNPEAVVTLRNISQKKIDAYTLGIYCYDRYGNAVNHYAYGINRFGGLSQETLSPNEVDRESTWTLFGHENTAKIKVVIEKVHFTNGTNWYPKKGHSIFIEGISNK